MDIDELRSVGKALLDNLTMENGQLDADSLEFVRQVGEEIDREKIAIAELFGGELAARARCDFVRQFRKITAESLTDLIQRMKWQELRRKWTPPQGDTVFGTSCLAKEFQNVMKESMTESLRLTNAIAAVAEVSLGRCDALLTLLSSADTADGHMPLLPCQMTKQWVALTSTFVDQLRATCHTVSPQDLNPGAALYEDPSCIDLRNNCRVAQDHSRRMIEASSDFIRLTAETHSDSVVKTALFRLLNQKLSWDDFLLQGHEKEPVTTFGVPQLMDLMRNLFHERADAEVRAVEKATEQAIAETLMGQISALRTGLIKLKELTPTVGTWNCFLSCKREALNDFMTNLAALHDSVEQQRLLLTDHTDQLKRVAQVWESPAMREVEELMEKHARLDTDILAHVKASVVGGPNYAKYFEHRLLDIYEMREILCSFESSNTFRQHCQLRSDLVAALQSVEFHLETQALTDEQDGHVGSSRENGSTQYFSLFDESERNSPDSSDDLWNQENDGNPGDSVFFDSLNVTTDFSEV
ncbi:hypothetical protein BV898_10528 [Hypsibius exemplaris]|uniref:Uncharacterized protein n=1 Tax=Hypsibius exemplaris TaxID=2072580 RepID=A0A1W0WJF5_HYPEX|nr:hypothetical protein BV898_10528 [Hypsibius exemplaris]